MKLVVAYRASELGEKVLAQAIERARQSGAQIYLVTSLVGGGDTPEEVIEQARTDLDQAAALLAKNGIAAETHRLIRCPPLISSRFKVQSSKLNLGVFNLEL